MEYKWIQSMAVNEKKIDSQHKRLFKQIGAVADALTSKKDLMGSLRDANHFLYIYYKEHFSYEENYMKKNRFPGLNKHARVHQKFIRFYEKFQQELMKKAIAGKLNSFEVRQMLENIKKYLAQWLSNHIKGMDQEYVRYIKSHTKKGL